MSCKGDRAVQVVSPKSGICGIMDGRKAETECEEFGARVTKKIVDPRKPKADLAMVLAHNIAHRKR